MTKKIKKFLYKILGRTLYLKVLHLSFFILYDLHFLRNNPVFKYHYFVRNLIQKGDCVVDIGANLGYFSRIFSRLVGREGKVISIEPVKPFYETLSWALRKKKNCLLYNYALGTENKKITMNLPKIDGFFRTGLAHVGSGINDENKNFTFETEMVRGSELLSTVQKIDYIKCDIEGYEEFVFPEIKEVIRKHLPIIQIETGGKHKEVVFPLLKDLGYVQYSVYKNKLVKNFSNEIESGDYLFLHHTQEREHSGLISKSDI